MTTPAADMLTQMRALAETLPTRCPTTLRVGPGVQDALRRVNAPAGLCWFRLLPYGVKVVDGDNYPPGQWRIFDQRDDELSSGVIPVPGATLTINLEGGTAKQMRVLTVDHDKGEYTVADPALFEMPAPPRWFL